MKIFAKFLSERRLMIIADAFLLSDRHFFTTEFDRCAGEGQETTADYTTYVIYDIFPFQLIS